MNINKLTIEGQKTPIGIDIKSPELGWKTESVDSKYQTAYQLQLSKDYGFSEIFFDSGKVASDEQAHIKYNGLKLETRTRYFVRVKIWDEFDKESQFSEPTFFETGFLGDEISAKWIEPEQEEAYSEPECIHIGQVFMPRERVPIEERLRPSQYLRKIFSVKKAVKQARLYATSHGIYDAYINGVKISDRYFAPEITSYKNRLLYQTYDVTNYLSSGKNSLGVILADGWHIGRIGLSGDSCQYENKLAFLGQLEIQYCDGSIEVIESDESFKSHIGKHVYADLFMGEMHDMRLDVNGFSKVGFDDSDWKQVKVVDYSKEQLIGQAKPPIKAVEKLSPLKIIITPKGESVLDFGKVIAGIVSMKARGKAGSKIQLEFCEQLDEEGNFWNHIAGRNNDQLDVMILSGEGEEIFEPSFTYHGFRYVKVSGYSEEIRLDKFTALVLGTELDKTLEFSTSDKQINKLQENIYNSQVGNMISLPTDCPQREKSGFTGDIQVFGVTGCYNMDLEYFLKDWLNDVRYEQCENGEIPNIVPNYPKMKELQQRTNGCQSSAGWGDACVILPWILYREYGNISVLVDNYDMMKKWIKYIEKESPDYIWRNDKHFGDWLIPSLTKFGMNIDESLKDIRYIVATCYFSRCANILVKISEILNSEVDTKYYENLERNIKKAFVDKFIVDNRLTMDYQGMYVLALAMEMLDEQQSIIMAKYLEDMIKKNDYKLDTGFMSVRYLLPILVKHEFYDTAKRVLFQNQCPSWLYQVEKGATTIWEKWDAIMPDGKVNAVSFNHYAFGCIGEFLYEYIGGLKPLKPGYKEFKIEPILNLGIDSVNMKYISAYGSIEINWKKQDEKLKLDCRVPFNTKAYIKINNDIKELGHGMHSIELAI